MSNNLTLIPLKLSEANNLVQKWHRHHKPVVGHKFSIGAVKDGEIVGVAIVGRPVARGYDNGMTLEVNRLVTNGTKNACSFLYGRAWRAAQKLGYTRLITYILSTENGASLHGAGWKCIGKTRGGSWNCKSRPRVDEHPLQAKMCFEKTREKQK